MTAAADVQSTLRQQDFYRLKQTVVSPGDIYELDVGTKAVYIGPNSDVAEVELTYFDPNEPGSQLATATVSVNGPFVGTLFALNKTILPATSQPARILVSPSDVVNNSYRSPLSFAQRAYNVPAIIDLMVALSPIADVPSVRADKTFRFPSVPYDLSALPDAASTDVYIPIYGRRMVTISAFSADHAAIRVSLVSLLPGAPTAPRVIGEIDIPAAAPGFKNSQAYVVRASDAGRQGNTYDNAGNLTAVYDESDQTWSDLIGSPSGAASLITPRARGMADILMLNISDLTGGGPGTRYVDLYVKVSDRED